MSTARHPGVQDETKCCKDNNVSSDMKSETRRQLHNYLETDKPTWNLERNKLGELDVFLAHSPLSLQQGSAHFHEVSLVSSS